VGFCPPIQFLQLEKHSQFVHFMPRVHRVHPLWSWEDMVQVQMPRLVQPQHHSLLLMTREITSLGSWVFMDFCHSGTSQWWFRCFFLPEQQQPVDLQMPCHSPRSRWSLGCHSTHCWMSSATTTLSNTQQHSKEGMGKRMGSNLVLQTNSKGFKVRGFWRALVRVCLHVFKFFCNNFKHHLLHAKCSGMCWKCWKHKVHATCSWGLEWQWHWTRLVHSLFIELVVNLCFVLQDWSLECTCARVAMPGFCTSARKLAWRVLCKERCG